MRKIYLLTISLNILIAIFISKILLLTTNTLLNNGNWDSEKTKLEMGVMGAWNFFSQAQALAGNHLNLGAWHGFQEVISRESFKYDLVEFDTYISGEAYLISHFMIDDDTKISVKISNQPMENFCLVIDKSGKFLKKTSLQSLKIEPDQWFHTKIELNNNQAKMIINEQSFSCEIPKTSQSKIGFKGGQYDTLLDNIVIKNNNKTIFQENFSNNKNFVLIAVFVFIFLALIQIFLKKRKIAVFSFVLINVSLLLSMILIYLYLLIFFTGKYPNPESFLANLKKQEQKWSDNEFELNSNQVMTEFKNDDHEKIMFVGSSQTWGAGASSSEKAFPAIFEKLLNKKIIQEPLVATSATKVLGVSTDQNIVVVNTGISGQTSSELLEEYKKKWIDINPKAVFINLSSNDFTYGNFEERFKKNIQTFIDLNNKNNIKTVLLVEAVSVELSNDNPLHEILFDIANNEGVLLIDINKYLKDKNDTGLIWWDYIHPTDYGHQLIVESIMKSIANDDGFI
ncbi:MAG: SGNH/GDSL hydrolase family protein [Candidatus Pacebacteria bacterium]|jgi:lysophospholipase L1-like esterase|nr:SGNH/GDSL hydrolase family protein [Candidatus Paceibacterota bacterium]MBT4004762.1 SGNH/GDSL hydrolase family protein [Candidatus Paceibacterota bacterium]MBT6899247.1 SGNH/GDSL hydrolase family protein [Candidatus Paceibacterota bacterium]MBT7184147.1 SGNH/GDSL hydrolase family protein [Candidatus Paceibacterota bacterium]MBT7310021.1 SGNH/GDSL hydrolase family protein [Candidatus Paceibacterota bacterium]